MIISTDLYYFLFHLPIFLIDLTFLSYIYFNDFKLRHIFLWSLAAGTLSTFLSSVGEITFGILYATNISKKYQRFDIFWVFLFLELNLIDINLQLLVTKIVFLFLSVQSSTISNSIKLIIDVIFAIVMSQVLMKKKLFINSIREQIQKKIAIWRPAVIYLIVTCVSLYCLEFAFSFLEITDILTLLILLTLILFMVINVFSLFFIVKSYQYSLELLVIKHAEASKRAYYSALEQQRINTSRILHDYKNLLATLQLSLQKSSPHHSSDVRTIVTQAQDALQKAEIGKDALALIESDPLRSLLYLKWSESANRGITMYMHTKDTVRSLESDVGFAIIRILGILIDNAIDETATLKLKSFRVLLLPARDHLEIVVANPIPDGFDLTRLNQKGFTTKGSGHGQGMSIINDLIQQNPNISMRKAIINNDQLKITLFIGGKAHA